MLNASLCCSVLLSTLAIAEPAPEAASPMEVEISLVEIAEKPGTFDVVALVRATADGRLIAAPHMRVPGDQTSVLAVENDDGDRITLSIGPMFRGQEAQWLVVWRRDGETIARSTGRVETFGAD